MAKPDVYIEIARFESTQAYRDDPSIIKSPLEMIIKAKNLRGLWTGLQVEDPREMYMIVAWDSVEDHYAFMADKENWKRCYEAYLPSASFDINARGSLLHVPFNADPYVHINKPVTEFTLMELKSGQKAETIEAILRRESAERDEVLGQDEASRGRFTWGCPREIAEIYVIMTGWDSVEDSEIFRKKHKDRIDNFISSLSQVASGSTALYQLNKFVG